MIRDPFLDRLHRVLAAMATETRNQSGPQAFVTLQNVVGSTRAGRSADTLLADAHYGLTLLERRVVEAVTDSAIASVHQNTLERLRAAMSFSALQKPLDAYRRDHTRPELLDAIIMLDRAVTVNEIAQEKVGQWLEQLDALRKRIQSSNDVPIHLSSMLVAQCELIERAAKRYDLDGATGFRDQVYCSLGVLELRLKEHEEWGSVELTKETLDWLLRIAGTVELTQAAALTLPFFSGVAGYLPPPG
jgi:hypothetical protein